VAQLVQYGTVPLRRPRLDPSGLTPSPPCSPLAIAEFGGIALGLVGFASAFFSYFRRRAISRTSHFDLAARHRRVRLNRALGLVASAFFLFSYGRRRLSPARDLANLPA